jgi:hypothetical protein
MQGYSVVPDLRFSWQWRCGWWCSGFPLPPYLLWRSCINHYSTMLILLLFCSKFHMKLCRCMIKLPDVLKYEIWCFQYDSCFIDTVTNLLKSLRRSLCFVRQYDVFCMCYTIYKLEQIHNSFQLGIFLCSDSVNEARHTVKVTCPIGRS